MKYIYIYISLLHLDSFIKEKITAGDVISIDKSTGRITKLGRSYSRSKDYDALGPHINFIQVIH